MVRMPFSQIQQAPGPGFIMVGQSLDSLRGPLFGVWNQAVPKLTSIWLLFQIKIQVFDIKLTQFFYYIQ